jgi:hypothetical protein
VLCQSTWLEVVAEVGRAKSRDRSSSITKNQHGSIEKSFVKHTSPSDNRLALCLFAVTVLRAVRLAINFLDGDVLVGLCRVDFVVAEAGESKVGDAIISERMVDVVDVDMIAAEGF